MPPRTPAFWYSGDSADRFCGAVLMPLSALWLAGHRWNARRERNAYRSTIPVICVGNLVAGGGGKTPAALAILAMMREKNMASRPCFLTRGYGGKKAGPLVVDSAIHDSRAVGDEALLLAATAPTIVSRDRAAGARLAEREGFDLIIMDDGLQNPGLFKTLRLVVIDGATGFGNGRLLPAGPLRVPLTEGLNEADAFLLIGSDRHDLVATLPSKPLLRATMTVPSGWTIPTQRVVAFTGIARPEKFRTAAEALGIEIVAWHSYADHHVFSRKDLATLAASAASHDAPLLTTAKDAARLPRDFQPASGLFVLPIVLDWSVPEQAAALFASVLEVAP